MPNSRGEIIKANKKILTNAGVTASFFDDATKMTKDRVSLLVNKQIEDQKAIEAMIQARVAAAKEDDGGFFDDIVDVGKDILGTAGDVIGFGSRTVQSGWNELGDLLAVGGTKALDALPLPETIEQPYREAFEHRLASQSDTVQQSGASLSDFVENIRNKADGADYIAATGAEPGPAATYLGLANDIAADPLTGLATTNRAAKNALSAIERMAGPEVAAAVRRGGTEAGDAILAEQAIGATDNVGDVINMVEDPLTGIFRAPRPPATSIRDLLFDRAAAGAPSGSIDDIINSQLTALNGRGGLSWYGAETGIGRGLGGDIASRFRASDTGGAIRRVFVPTAKVADELGMAAADTTQGALRAGETARSRLRIKLAGAAADGVLEDGTKISDALSSEARRAFASELLENGGGRLAQVGEREGWVQIADDIYAPPVVADTIKAVWNKPPSDLARIYDNFMGWSKSQIVLNPLLNPAGWLRDITSNMLMATTVGKARFKDFIESKRLRDTLIKYELDAATAGDDISQEGFRAWNASKANLNETSLKRAWLLHEKGVAGRGGELFDDVSEAAASAARGKGPVGTRTISKLRQAHEELSRGAVFLRGLDEGMTATEALDHSLKALLDYTAVGLTKTERDIFQRLTLFYKFPRRVLPQALRFVVEEPGLSVALSRAGLGADLGERNRYGEPLGQYLDTPLEAGTGTILGPLVNEDGPLVGLASENGAPWITGLLNVGPGARSLEKQVPALDSLKRLIGGSSYSEGGVEGWLDKALRVPGIREGRDYELLDAERRLQETKDKVLAKGGTINGETALKLHAQLLGVPRAATYDAPTLIDLLLAKGEEPVTIGQIILGEPVPADSATDLLTLVKP